MQKIIASIDQGTTSSRCILYDFTGREISAAQMEHAQIMPQPGWVEHDPMEILRNVRSVMEIALAKAGKTFADLAALGIANQRETTVIWNRETGEPYARAIVWQDTRTDRICERMAAHGGQDRFREKTGLPISVYFSGVKIRWLFENDPTLLEEARAGRLLFGTIDSWLIWNLTGGVNGGAHKTDVTNASRTMLMNLSSLNWDAEILREFDIPACILPEILPSSGFFGVMREKDAEIPIAGALGDQQAAIFGQACYEPGMVKNTYGTGCFMLMNTGEKPVMSRNGLLATVGYQIGGAPAVYCLEGSIAYAGALIQWLRDNLKLISSSAEVEKAALEVEDNGGVYIAPAFSGLFAPYWRRDARGVIAGLTRFSSRGHLARATLEATAYQTWDVLKAMEKDSEIAIHELRVDGGMTRNNLLMQFQADILNVPVIRPKITETTALGAAYAAGLGIGYWKSAAELAGNWQAEKRFIPAMSADRRDEYLRDWGKAIERSFNWLD